MKAMKAMTAMTVYFGPEAAYCCQDRLANSIAPAGDQRLLLRSLVKAYHSWRKKRSPARWKRHNRGRLQMSKPSYYSLLIGMK